MMNFGGGFGGGGGGYGSMLQSHGPLGMQGFPRPGLGGSDRMIPGQGFGGMLQAPQPSLRGGDPFQGSAPTGSAGGWLNAIKESLGDLDPLDQAFLGASAVGGIANWWEGRGDRKENKRRYEDQMAEGRQHRQRMGENWNRAVGG